MASDNEEALYCHVTGVEPNHWTVTVCYDSLLAWNSIMAQVDNHVGGFALGPDLTRLSKCHRVRLVLSTNISVLTTVIVGFWRTNLK